MVPVIAKDIIARALCLDTAANSTPTFAGDQTLYQPALPMHKSSQGVCMASFLHYLYYTLSIGAHPELGNLQSGNFGNQFLPHQPVSFYSTMMSHHRYIESNCPARSLV
jgi:hypothetical protein